MSRAVLITGCSTGIGRATASHLARRGWPVYATARRPETLAALEADGCHALHLDVCDEDSMRAAVSTVEREHGAVGVLVNNAGYGLEAPVERLSMPELRREFETNLFGPTRLTQMVLPAMRAQRFGRIINVSSVGGRLAIPGGGAYHASKHALEALSDVLRFEVEGFGIDVVVIEPGAIRTRWVETATAGLDAAPDSRDPYAELTVAIGDQLRGAHRGALALTSAGPEVVARVIERAARARRPRTRYPVPFTARMFIVSRRLLGDRLWDASLRKRYPQPQAPSDDPEARR